MNVVDEHWQMLTGKSRKPLVTVSEDQPFLLHADVLPHWQRLVAKAAKAGFVLQMVSGWRGFEAVERLRCRIEVRGPGGKAEWARMPSRRSRRCAGSG